MSSAHDLDPIPEEQVPLMASIGRAVCYAATLEMTMQLDAISRLAAKHGLGVHLRDEVVNLEAMTGGRRLARLKRLDIPDELAKRISAAIEQRNWLIHHLLGFDFAVAIATGDMAHLIERVDDVTVACQSLHEEMSPAVFGRFERLLGMSRDALIRAVAAAEAPTDAEHEDVRELINMARVLNRYFVET